MPYSTSRHSIPYPPGATGKRRRGLGITPGCSKHHGPSWVVFIVRHNLESPGKAELQLITQIRLAYDLVWERFFIIDVGGFSPLWVSQSLCKGGLGYIRQLGLPFERTEGGSYHQGVNYRHQPQ